jgi:hypothetical protein
MISKKLNFISGVMRLRSAFHAVNTVVALHDISKAEWLRCVNPDDETHYIADFQVDGRKADAIINYTTRLAAVYMNATGALPGTLSKETLAADNAITVAIMRRLAGIQIKSNEEMFMHVATRLLGIDSALVKAGMTTDEVRYSLLVTYLVDALGEEFTEDATAALSVYVVKLGVTDQLNDSFFTSLLAEGDKYYAEYPDSISDAIDVIDVLIGRVVGDLSALR